MIAPMTVADTYFGCGAGVRQHSWPESGWSQYSGDKYRFGECSITTSPALKRNGWFLTMPDLRWHQDFTTGMTRERDLFKAREWDLHWPLLRHNEFLFGVTAGSSEHRQQHELADSAIVNGNNGASPTGQALLLKSERHYAGLLIDTRYTLAPITRTLLTYEQRQQSLWVNKPGQAYLLDGDIALWQLHITKEPIGYGFMWHWSLALQKGEIDKLHDMAPHDLASDDFMGLQAELGFMWRYRYTRQIHPYVNVAARNEHWLFFNTDDSKASVDSIHTLSYEISAGVSWRFR